MKFIGLALVALLLLVQVELWFGKNGVPRVRELQEKLQSQLAVNDLARLRNEQLTAEVNDLNEGLEMVEENARYDLGMVKPDEILVRISTANR